MKSAPPHKGSKKIAVVGSGPAGLMAATRASELGAQVTVFERRAGLGRKLLIAGSSGLNVSYDAPPEKFDEGFLDFYRKSDPEGAAKIEPSIRAFPPLKWLAFIESLGHPTFLGTSRRWFVREMKASGLLQSWVSALKHRGVLFQTGLELQTFSSLPAGVRLEFSRLDGELASVPHEFDSAILALGGGSWESPPPVWPQKFRELGIQVRDFEPSNVGYEIDFPPALLKEAEGQPIKNCVLTTARGSKQGELVITDYGVEGTPVYFTGCPGPATLKLKPELTLNEWMSLLRKPLTENLSPMRKLRKLSGLSDAALALIFHLTPEKIRNNLTQLGLHTYELPLPLKRPRPLLEAISSKGGVLWSEVTDTLMLEKFPGVYLAGEMLDWDAPTGGFLIQASVALGYVAGDFAAK